MTLDPQDKEQLIKYRIEQALETIKVVELLLENKQISTSVNRIYYGIFYSLQALALQHNFETSKHQQLIGWFNREFIKTQKIELEFGRILRTAYENRRSGDYDIFVEFEIHDILDSYENMKKFISRIQLYIEHNI